LKAPGYKNKISMNKIIRILVLFILLPFVSAAQQEIRIMSFNIRLDMKSDGENQWDKRKERLVAMLNYNAPDFIGGQEVMHHQLEYMLQNLSGYAHIGVGRDDGKQAGEYSCILYNKEKFDVLDQSTFWLSPTPDSVSKGWDAAIVRVCTYGLFRNKRSKQLFWVFNTHFDHIGKQARLESAKLIVQKIKELNTKNYPVLLSGDFNSKPDEPPAQYMMENMQNTRSISALVHGNADTWNAFKFGEKPNGCIDYIFCSNDKRISVKKFATLTDSYDMKYLSDHFPIMATLTISK
jgi:endonuclease/exonuclease/phosphatase family metal-dependent hydrolase